MCNGGEGIGEGVEVRGDEEWGYGVKVRGMKNGRRGLK